MKFKTTGRWGRLEKLLRVRQFIKSQFNDSYIVGLITARINVLAREEAHETLKIAERHYMSSRADTYGERVELDNFLQKAQQD